ncbi:hypothetical protein LWI28_023366 [Acer negundo]|uniref:CCHC-type domain-containing protein n=1 Tax=Acer negundo TaxID=4023 RepID=A0AAD5NK89_ACENE|nr:hypothetical protein LWI28_023366 [Acer negundo]
MPGYPKKNRKRGPKEGLKQKMSGGVKCRGCGEFGHNIKTCKAKDGGRGNHTNVGTIKDNLSARKRHFESGSYSTSTTKRRVQVQLHVGEGLSQNATRNINYNTFGEQASQTVGGSSSQPVTTSAPLHLTCNTTQPTQSRADPGTVADLDIDWSGLF